MKPSTAHADAVAKAEVSGSDKDLATADSLFETLRRAEIKINWQRRG